MKKNLLIVASLLMTLTNLYSCNDMKCEIPEQTERKYADSNVYDELVGNLALAVNKAVVNSPDFRKLVKEQVMLQFDGDYDMLLQTAAPMTITPVQGAVTRSSGEFTVADMLEYYYPVGTTRISDKSILDELAELYPNLQISVPVHADEWNPEEYTPVVCFIPSDYVDLETPTVQGFDAEGNSVTIDAINEPDEPVIVIGLSERSGGVIGDGEWGGTVPPLQQLCAPVVTGSYTNNTVVLSWTCISVNISPQGYKIYRSDLNGNGEYTLVATVGASVKSYKDTEILANRSYSYKVASYNGFQNKMSEPIVIETNYDKPEAVSYLSVDAIGKRRLKVEWTNPSTEFYSTRIERLCGIDNEPYKLVAVIEPHENVYFDTDVEPGVKYTYRVRKVDNQGRLSDAYTAYAYATFRNPDAASKIYLKQIKCNLNLVEGWLLGKPEFEFKVAGMDNRNDKTPKDLQSSAFVKFDSRSGVSQIFNGVLMYNWSYFNHLQYYPILTFAAEELDNGSSVTINVKASVAVKASEGIELGASVEVPLKFSTQGEYCGESKILYFEDPETWLDYPRNELRILISEQP